ncbi:response regulator [Aquincola sp. S2]|uniref:histidine kinase n=1 Tax=Pseudaquabacterium terrae TaxID=2732868 RepID=A0ABX2EUJ9_9BURK|nr:ATP-binding protein [Aquabacterium terrae]NRF72157.1 response regulator [Aquabacterium terrae]
MADAPVFAAYDRAKVEAAIAKDVTAVLREAEESLQRAQASGNAAAQLDALRMRAAANSMQRNFNALGADVELGLPLARELGDADAQCAFMGYRAAALQAKGQATEALAQLDEALALAERHKLHHASGQLHRRKGRIFGDLGRKADALAAYQAAYAVYEAQGDAEAMASVLTALGVLHSKARSGEADIDVAIGYFERALKDAGRLDRSVAHVLLADIYADRKDFKRARQHYEQSVATRPRVEPFDHRDYVAVKFARGENKLTEAIGLLDRARAHYAQTKDLKPWIQIELSRAEVLVQLGQMPAAVQALKSARSIKEKVESSTYDVEFHERAAAIGLSLGDHAAAYREIAELRQAERRLQQAEKAKMAEELRVRFEVKQKETENALLRAQGKAAETQRFALILGSALALVLLAGLALYLRRRAIAARTESAYSKRLAASEMQRANDLQASNETLERLAALGPQIAAEREAARIHRALCDDVGRLMPVRSATVWMLEGEQLVLCHGMPADCPALSVRLDDEASSIARCARERRECTTQDMDELRWQDDTPRSALCTPMVAGGELMGVLVLQGDNAQGYGEREQQLARMLAAYGAVALANAANAQRLNAASQAKSWFLASMSHELRSPLNAMLGFSRLLQREATLTPRARHDLGIVLKSGEHLYTLINEVLEFSKAGAAQLTLQVRAFDLYALLDELQAMFSLTAIQKGLALEVSVRPSVPQGMQTDAIKLRQVLINLLSNAMKFTERGGVRLEVQVVSQRVSFSVIDTGVGIAADEQAHLGEVFVQASAGRRAAEGTGLGLAISRRYVELMGGELTLTSVPGQGTAARFSLPLPPVDLASPPAAPATGTLGGVVGLAPGTQTRRMLVADDSADSRQLLVRLLEPLGFEMREAANGLEAVQTCQAWEPDLVWMDMRMPVVDGLEATRRIKAAQPAIVVIALTASSFEEDRAQMLATGCDDFLRKPFSEAALLEAIETHLRVRFVREAPPTAEASEDLGSLTSAQREALRSALQLLDVEGIERSIEAIRETNGAVADQLSRLIDQFRYREVLDLLEQWCDVSG